MKNLKKISILCLFVLGTIAVVFISCGKDDNTVTDISLNQSSLTLAIGNEYILVATVTPKDAAGVTWTSSNSAVATVANGTVTAKAEGIVTITAKAGGKTATCVVTVNNNVVDIYNMTGKINGKPFAWPTRTGSADVVGDLLSLTARAEGGYFIPRISLSVPVDVVVGQSYPLGPEEDCRVHFTDADGYQTGIGEGMITITEYNKTLQIIKGTFYFSTPESMFTPAYFITDGSFSFVYDIR